uniref:tRNA 4-demethylwyosine synthase (AdoMet-dependent) n=1 Tax=Jaculus jaculus TaxID=51337 RepID=A0A8C5LGE2_JACJA
VDPPLAVWDLSSSLLSLWMNRFYIYLGFALGITLWICVQIVMKKQGFARILAKAVTSLHLPVAIIDLRDYDPDDHLVEEITSKNVCAFLVATYTDGRPTESAEWFCRWLEDAASDFRFGKTHLKGLRYAVFGLGNSAYSSHFNKVGTNVDKWLWMLGAHRVLTRGEGDCNVVQSKHGSIEADFRAWKTKFISQLQALCKGEKKKSCGGKCKKGKCESKPRGSGETQPASGAQGESHHREAEEEEPCESTSEDDFGTDDHQSPSSVVDVEDLGDIMNHMRKEKRENDQDEKASVLRNTEKNEDNKGRAMITPALREALTKQVDAPGARRLLQSHRCMEATPSLACANKCVFCWRHHTNPVGTEWRWKMDQPEMILKEAIENHQNMINQFKGVPGVQSTRFEEGMQIKHCALSLVGEPIMYPEINRLLKLLHQCGISSFLVTNAQFPVEIKNLIPVTQLYVSVDASTKDSLKKIDRPLFKDFWQRFLDSLKALAAKQQRTVYRLTLVKSWNVDELQAYAELVSLGNPDFIEVKGVTYCGESAASSLTMANVPWHEEVVRFVRELVTLIPDYEIACEHEHSNCLLIAHRKFKIGGEWWTWIDYSGFQELMRQYEESGGSKTFSARDYMARTPQWALFGARERGFDPKDTRYQRKNKAKDISGC